ncbi:CaiB/BaiF CoA transferase family protein [Cupriavidus sp. 2TAF22]|uniref:CaiB/BaiF CoA transferase family protein n=1 Tax=unclassified Cupriavidus TaxID=2640874 RepID=UPI003F933ABA
MLRKALEGLKVVEFAQIAAGPLCAMLLADMGASVTKVEGPDGDLGRQLGPGWIGEDSALYHGFNRNKRGICLDLKTAEGLAVARRLVARADVVIESMRPGVMARLGLAYEQVAADNPRLVYCSVSAYGQGGPYAHEAGVDGILQADSGLMSLVGVPGAEPCKVQAPVVDMMTGYVACVGVLAKLNARERDGQGGHLDVNLLNAALALQQASLTSYLADGVLPERIGSAAPYSAPNEAFQCADGWIMVAAYNGSRWPTLCGVLGLAHIAQEPRFSSSARRVEHRAAMKAELGAVFRTRAAAHWLRVLKDADILCAKVASYEDATRHPQVLANRMIASMEGGAHGEIRMPGFPINSAVENALPHTRAPSLGEHNREILEELAFGADEVAGMVAAGALCAAH